MLATFDLAGHVTGIILKSDLTTDSLNDIIAEIDKKLEVYEKLNLFIEIEKGNNVSFKALLKGINYKYSHVENFDKIAIVTDRIWFQNAVNVSDVFLSINVRTYNLEERLEAIQWISL